MRLILPLAISLFLTGCAVTGQVSTDAGTVADGIAVPSTSRASGPAASPAARTPSGRQDMAAAKAPPILETPRFENLIDRIVSGFAMPPLAHPLVEQHERWIARNPEYLNRVFERGGKYLYHIVEELENRRMPTELALLPIVESAFNPNALSKAKAAGLWQFIPSTGRIYALEQNWWTDERRDVIESTRAALDYLQRLYELQGNDWFLALASYNWGEGAVMRARKRNEAARKPTDYVSLKMPKETQHYVPKLIALRNVLSRSKELGLNLPVIPNLPFFVVIDKEQSIDLSLAAKFASMTVAEFTELNPSLNRPVITVTRTDRIILPADRAAGFQRQLQDHVSRGLPLVTWKPYTLKENDTLVSLARNAGVSAQDLIRANSLKQNARPLPGTVLLAPISIDTPEPAIETTLAKFTGSRVIEKETLGPVYHRVTKKDTLAKIAKRYGVAASDIRSTNHFENEPAVGQRLLIRSARTQTVVTDERGQRTVLSAVEGPAAAMDTSAAAAKKPATPARKTGAAKGNDKAKKANPPEKKKKTAEKKSSDKKSSEKKSPAKSPGSTQTQASS
ncbi:MAG: LysM peptidoglycan-binding domain-containing protein [Burkholderiaceae bacterium]|jgi:membrane-bound lytic murein transglycosylase D|nr:LysM peptidoglycan-binding domain-containing protein [Burkholderiaceae bacterium]